MQYLPELMKGMSPFRLTRLFLFQAKLIGYALWENKVLESDFEKLGIDARGIVERTRAKQAVAMRTAIGALGVDVDNERNPIFQLISGIVEFVFPTDETRGRPLAQARAAVDAFQRVFIPPSDALSVHAQHTIRTARGEIARAEGFDA
jgi:hypothetical protein